MHKPESVLKMRRTKLCGILRYKLFSYSQPEDQI